MEKIYNRYGISPDLSKEQKLAALEKHKLKVLRKLNHVFGNPEKEALLNEELESLEQVMETLEETGVKLSLDDILLDLKESSKAKTLTSKEEKILIKEKERLIKSEETDMDDVISLIGDVITYYLRERIFEKYEYWLLYGARMGLLYCMKFLNNYYTHDVYGAQDEQRALYWLKKGAELGDKDCLEDLGIYYADQEAEYYDPAKAAMCFVKAADAEHANSYIFAFQMFHRLGEYKKAETCLHAADRMGIKSAAHWFGMIYSNGKNSTGMQDMQLAQQWLEKEYERYPNGPICYDLGMTYLQNGEKEKGLAVLMRGYREFELEVCKEALMSQEPMTE